VLSLYRTARALLQEVRQAARCQGIRRRHYAAAVGSITGSVIVIARRSIVDWPTVLLALATALLLWRFKKLQEPIIVNAAALIGLVVYPLIHSHAA
jgi:chromate transport protein ChrA